jgi:endonuclease-3
LSALGEELLRRLRTAYALRPDDFVSLQAYLRSRSPFEVLVATVLSQNTTDKAALEALNDLSRIMPITPDSLYRAGVKVIAKAIKRAGMYRVKAHYLWRISKTVMENSGGGFDAMLRGDPREVRERIMALPGVGNKTVDVLLTVLGILERVPIDTHVYRVAVRIGLIKAGMRYEEAHELLARVFAEGSRHEAHLLLITHGRKTCRARKPRCEVCVLTDLCRYYAGRGRGV